MEHLAMDFSAGASYEWRIGYDTFRDGLAVYLVVVGPDKLVTHIAAPLTFEPVPRLVSSPRPPTFAMSPALAQQLMEALAKQGVKPESERKLEGLLEATRRHLEDMRVMAGLESATVKAQGDNG